jgi:hypothetical protein
VLLVKKELRHIIWMNMATKVMLLVKKELRQIIWMNKATEVMLLVKNPCGLEYNPYCLWRTGEQRYKPPEYQRENT